MNNEIEKPKIFDDLYSELTPTDSQRKRVANVIFENNFSQSSNQSSSTFVNKKMNKFFNVKSLSIFGGLAFAAFLIIPMGFYMLTSNLQRNESIIAEDGITTSNFERANLQVDGSDDEYKDYVINEVSNNTVVGSIDSEGYGLDFPSKMMAPTIESDLMYYIPPVAQNPEFEDTTTDQGERAQVREATISVTVEEFQQGYGEISSKITAVGGYLLSVGTSTSETYSYSNMQVRLPVEKFDEFMNFVRGIGTVVSENINIVDKQSEVTEYSNKIQTNSTRIDELKAKTILTTIEKNELAELEKMLEQDNEKLLSLRQETEFSTVWVYLSSNIDDEDDGWTIGGTWSEVVDALSYVFQFWASAIMWLIVPLACLLPIVVIIYILILFRKKKDKLSK
jgi:hypothetical protein